MAYAALVTLLLLVQYIAFSILVGKARVKSKIDAPATTGEPMFERAQRIHINTLEQLMVTIPALWLCAYYFNPLLAAILGLVFFIGRIIYYKSYIADPTKRGTGMMIGFAANIAMMGCALWGIIGKLI